MEKNENKENEFLTKLRESDKMVKDDAAEYAHKFREFAKFVASGECKIKGENDERDDS